MVQKGKFIVLDGNDGSGKATQAGYLQRYLQALGKAVIPMSFPRYKDTIFGKLLEECLAGLHGNFVELDPYIASLPYACDRMISGQFIKKMLAMGSYIVCDRYISANQIHQGGKISDLEERTKFLTWLNQLEYGEFRIPSPDVSIYLDVPLEISLSLMNGKKRDTVEENKVYLENSVVSAQWLMMQETGKWIHICCAPEGVMLDPVTISKEVVKKLRDRGDI